MSVFKDFPGLENLEKKIKYFQGPAGALKTTNIWSHIWYSTMQLTEKPVTCIECLIVYASIFLLNQRSV